MLTVGFVAVLGLSLTAVSVVSEPHVGAEGTDPAITIKDFQYIPADLAVKVGQTISITNDDDAPHTVTAKDGTFNADVPAHGKATLSVPKAGTFPYYCTYHPGQHNPATIRAS
jgi:plastocyanin